MPIRDDVETRRKYFREYMRRRRGSSKSDDPEQILKAFMLRVDAAMQAAVFAGKPTKQTINAAKHVAAAWKKLAEQMESKRP
jgi:hypothetical protein